MKHFSLFLLVLCSCLISCTNKKKTVQQKSFYYPLNYFYSGNYAFREFLSATVDVSNVEGHVKFVVSLSGVTSPLDSYSVHIHKKDLSEPFGYSGNPVIDLDHLQMGHAIVTKEVHDIDFDYFTKEFNGFFVVHDPLNIQNDTTTLLVYGKIGVID